MKPEYIYRATVARVTDGDTIVLDIDLGCHVWLHGVKIRLLGVWAPEIKGAEKVEGDAAKKALAEVLPVGYPVVVQTIRDGTDKYGRLLGVVWTKDGTFNLNESLPTYKQP